MPIATNPWSAAVALGFYGKTKTMLSVVATRPSEGENAVRAVRKEDTGV